MFLTFSHLKAVALILLVKSLSVFCHHCILRARPSLNFGGSHSSGIAWENPWKIRISQRSGKEPNYLSLSPPHVTVPETPSSGDSVSSDFILAKSRAGSEFASYTFVLECEGSCELQHRPSQVTFSLWNTLEPSLAAGNQYFENLITGSQVQLSFYLRTLPSGDAVFNISFG